MSLLDDNEIFYEFVPNEEDGYVHMEFSYYKDVASIKEIIETWLSDAGLTKGKNYTINSAKPSSRHNNAARVYFFDDGTFIMAKMIAS